MTRKELVEWSDGNLGAAKFLVELMRPENQAVSQGIIAILKLATTIRGTNLYILWSDLGNKDLTLVEEICKQTPIEELEDACNRQDRSGVEIVKKYINTE